MFPTSGIAESTDNATSPKDAIVAKTVQYLKIKKTGTPHEELQTIAHSVYGESQKSDIDYRLVLAVMKVESNYRNNAVSQKGARGLLQIKPSLAKHIAKDVGIHIEDANCLHEPEKNIKIGVSYLSKLINMFDNITSALHAYNVGPAKVRKPKNLEDAPSTHFTKKVMNEYRRIVEVLPDPAFEQAD